MFSIHHFLWKISNVFTLHHFLVHTKMRWAQICNFYHFLQLSFRVQLGGSMPPDVHHLVFCSIYHIRHPCRDAAPQLQLYDIVREQESSGKTRSSLNITPTVAVSTQPVVQCPQWWGCFDGVGRNKTFLFLFNRHKPKADFWWVTGKCRGWMSYSLIGQ